MRGGLGLSCKGGLGVGGGVRERLMGMLVFIRKFLLLAVVVVYVYE